MRRFSKVHCQIEPVPAVFKIMGRPLRYLPPREDGAWHLVEITGRTVQSRHLLRPSSRLNRLILGCLGRAQRQTGVRIHDFVFLSNHFHLLASVETVEQQASFLRCLGWMAVEVRHVHGWDGKLWKREGRSIPLSDEKEAQIARLRYLYSHGVKENLVASPDEWPGASSVSARLRGYRTIEGDWVDRTAIHRAGPRRSRRDRDFTTAEVVELSPLPAWAHLSRSEYRDRVTQMVEDIRQEARARRQLQGKRPLGVDAALRVDPWSRPANTKRTAAPRFHAATRRVYLKMREAYSRFLEAYREASRRFRQGELNVRFPAGCFRPAPAFTPD